MSSIIIASVPFHGHVTPLLAVARHFVARGDGVRFITGARFANVVAATGATHVPLPAGADFDDRVDFNELFPERAALKGIKALAFDIEHIFITPSRPQFEAVMAAHAAEPADAVLTDPAFAGGAFVLGYPRAHRPAVVVGGVVPLPLASRDTAPYGLGLPPAKWFNRPRNKVLTALSRRIFAGVDRVADAMYSDVHGVPLPFPLLDWAGHADAVVQFTVPAFEYPRADAPATLHFAGPVSATGSHAPRPSWWADLDSGRPIVHVTQGTVANKDFDQLITPTLEALARDDVLVVVSTGGRPLETLPPLPDNARAAEYLPYDELLPRTDVYVTNGGYGGVQYALRYGVPIVATGGKEDKPEVGARVAWSGVGRRIRSEKPNSAALRRAIRRVLDEPSYREASRRISADMAAAPGLDTLTTVFDELTGQPPAAKEPLRSLVGG
jgi:UDP:flavonoid glycosyltransferase YjiC (YdhE family)